MLPSPFLIPGFGPVEAEFNKKKLEKLSRALGKKTKLKTLISNL